MITNASAGCLGAALSGTSAGSEVAADRSLESGIHLLITLAFVVVY